MKMSKHSMIAKVKGLSFWAITVGMRRSSGHCWRESGGARTVVVPEGHFVVVAVKGEETKRFVVKLDYLNDPDFLRLLELAREEYGYGQKGPLAVPCNPQELQNIIDSRMRCT